LHDSTNALSTGRIVRQFLFGRRRNRYRVYFTVVGETVKIVHIRHGARREPSPALGVPYNDFPFIVSHPRKLNLHTMLRHQFREPFAPFDQNDRIAVE
jgi:hypothetical protein